jgi:hypothetical protein
MITNLQSWHERFGKVASEAEAACFITRASEVQLAAIAQLKSEINEVRAQNHLAGEGSDENTANFFLSLECMLSALLHELQMWQFLKEDRPDEAWGELVSAQNALAAAPRAHKEGNLALVRVPWLADVERVVFPPQVFMSPGLVAHRSTCSICREPYGKCDHIAGRAYMGQFCGVLRAEVEGREVSFVTVPADKRSRVISFMDENGRRNRMTWRLEAL